MPPPFGVGAPRAREEGWAEAEREQAERERADLDELLGVFGERLRSLERLGFLKSQYCAATTAAPVGDYSRHLRPAESRRRRDPLDELREHIDGLVPPGARTRSTPRRAEQERRAEENREWARAARGGVFAGGE